MRTRNLIEGIIMLSIGIAAIAAALLFESVLDKTLPRIAGYCLMFGILTTGKYLYWNLPKNRELRKKLIAYENIERNDELQVRIRNQAGKIAHDAGIYALCASIFIADILGQLEIIRNAGITILFLGICLALQLIAEWVSFKHISKKF